MKQPPWDSPAPNWTAVSSGGLPSLPTRHTVLPGHKVTASLRGVLVEMEVADASDPNSLVARVVGFEGIVGDKYKGLTIGESVTVPRDALASFIA